LPEFVGVGPRRRRSREIVLEPPAQYIEEEIRGRDDQRVPPDALYMLQSIRVFMHFEKEVFEKLWKHADVMKLHADQCLFTAGDQIENIYMLQTSKVNLFMGESGVTPGYLKCVNTGELITPPHSFTDVLTGHTSRVET
jgi:lysophospholipid hydrolase